MMKNSIRFFNRCFDKQRLKNFILWFFSKYGERKTIQLIEGLKIVGFQYVTKAGISIGIDDLKIPFIKSEYIRVTEHKIKEAEVDYQRGNITEIERQQQFIDEWSFVSEKLKRQVIQFFKATDIFNPIYMMAFSGARGNISQIRQLIGMRGLMADPQGQILDFPIRSSFREGLTLTEYLISCYGARKGVVDTALRTATSGYLTRRLVDVTQQVVIGRQNCHTNRGIQFTSLMEGTKTLLPLKDRLIGRVLLNDIIIIQQVTKKKYKIGHKNQEISPRLSSEINRVNNRVLLRSPLTCYSKNSICQLCYGWNLAHNFIVSIGDAVGVLAAQSIGEPGTQLTMRTFHTGGVFTGSLIDQIYAPFGGEVNYINSFKGVLVRTPKGRVGFLTKTEGALQVKAKYTSNLINSGSQMKLINLFFSNQLKINLINRSKIQFLLRKLLLIEKNLKSVKNISHPSLTFNIPIHAILFTRQGCLILEKELIAELSSLSILENRRQETEQEVFTPIAGQIFFEDLTLIEKTKRDGSSQKMTSGLGSLWVVSATEWHSLIHAYIFPSHGDFISNSSSIQKLQILMEKSYYFDKAISKSIKSFNNFKSKFFLIKPSSKLIPESHLLDNISLNRTFFSTPFRKIHYRNFRYFVSVNNLNQFLANFVYSFSNSKNNNLSTRDQFIKNDQTKFELNSLVLGLNFRFYQNNPISRIQKRKSKSNFLLYTLQSNSQQYGYFFSTFSFNPKIKRKLKKPVISRKLFNFQSKSFKRNKYQYWGSEYSLLIINIVHSDFWVFSRKNPSISFDFIFSNRNSNFYYLYDKFIKTRKINFLQKKESIFRFQKYRVFKSFCNNLIFNNTVLHFSPLQILNFLRGSSWISAKQASSILINRQSIINFQSSKLWRLSGQNILQTSYIYIEKNREPCVFNASEKLLSYIPHFCLTKSYTINPTIKPILINPSLLINVSNKSSFLYYYIIQNFFISFYYKHFLDLKFNNYFYDLFKKENKKIGFQAQFKLLTIPIFINIKKKLPKLPLQIKKIFFKAEIFTLLQKNDLLKSNLKRQQNYFYWPCTYRKKTFTKDFGSFLNFGSEFKKIIIFDRQLVLVDFIYNKIFCKFSLLNLFSYKQFHKSKIRFSAHRLILETLVIFQKINSYIKPKSYYSKIVNLNTNYKNQIYFNSLTLNFIKYYFISFNKLPIKANYSDNLLYFDSSSFYYNKKIFLKTNFLQTIQVKTKTLFNLEYPVFLKTYDPLRKKSIKIFNFNKFKKKKKKVSFYVFYDLASFAAKTFHLNFIKKLDFQSLLDKKIQNTNIIKIFNKNFESSSIKNSIYLNFFSPSKDSEIIYTNSRGQRLEENFIILTQSNLRTFNLQEPTPISYSNILMLGNFLRYGNKFEKQQVISKSGQIIYIGKNSFIIREAAPFLITSKSLINVSQDEVIKQGSRLFTFLSYRIKTGDITQGIPRIEEFFEARLTRDGLPLNKNLHTQIKQLFQTYNLKLSTFEATRKSFETIQYLIINEIQKVYCSQGIYIADKHLEIVIRQMTAKVQVINGGQTGLLCGELIELDWIHSIEQRWGDEEILYEPIVLGITKSCLETESFISAASFQETTRILTKAAIQNKIDFIRGLKQNVILGNLIPAGTGFFSPLYFKYSKVD